VDIVFFYNALNLFFLMFNVMPNVCEFSELFKREHRIYTFAICDNAPLLIVEPFVPLIYQGFIMKRIS
jgi:hypothetical protein